MTIIIAWYHFNRIAYVIPKKGFERLLQARMVTWSHGEWCILCSEYSIQHLAGGFEYDGVYR